MRERAVERTEGDGPPALARHLDGQKGRFDGRQARPALDREAVATDLRRQAAARGRCRLRSLDVNHREELDVRGNTTGGRERVDNDAVATGNRERHRLPDASVLRNRRILVEQGTQVARDDDQVDPRVRAGAGAVAGQRRPRGLQDPQSDLDGAAGLDWSRRPEALEPERLRRSDRRDNRPGTRTPAAASRSNSHDRNDDHRQQRVSPARHDATDRRCRFASSQCQNGGARTRNSAAARVHGAYASAGDPLAEDPVCAYQPA